MRIIGGAARGRTLTAPKGAATRPTSDRVRESIFNILGNLPGQPAARVLDLYAGSGALGLEALSRGAQALTAIDKDAHAIAAIQKNLAALGAEGRGKDVRTIKDDVIRALGRLPRELPFGLIFIDPPYATGDATRALEGLARRSDLLGEDTVVVVEHDRRNAPPESVPPLSRTDVREYGDTRVAFYTLARSQP